MNAVAEKGTDCTVTTIYDQTPNANHLHRGLPGGAVHTKDKGVDAAKHQMMVGGHPVYGAHFDPGMGYACRKTKGIATGNEPESMYMLVAGRHYNDQCCFDYGNTETSGNDDGNGSMEAVYFGSFATWSRGQGNGPWVKADMENGVWAGISGTVGPHT